MSLTITSTSQNHPAQFLGVQIPTVLIDGPVPVVLTDGMPAELRVVNEEGEKPESFVTLSVYGGAEEMRAINLVAHNGHLYCYDHVDNEPKHYDSYETFLADMQIHIKHAQMVAQALPGVKVELREVWDKIEAAVTVESGRDGYERACYQYGVKPKTEEEIYQYPIWEDAPLWQLEYHGWTRQEIYVEALIYARHKAIRRERGEPLVCGCDGCDGSCSSGDD